MRIRAKDSGIEEGDLTPMIDMTFQLIAFFMLVINFSDVEQDQRIKLPASQLAQPPEMPYEQPLTIHLSRANKIIFAGDELDDLGGLRSGLLQEKQIIERYTSTKTSDVTVVIRGDENSKTGMVQEIIQICQDLSFEKYALRGKQSEKSMLEGP